MGPEIETAAMTRPEGDADRGGHRRDAGLALADALRPAAAAHAGERGRREGGALQAAVQAVGLLPREQHLGGRAGAHRQGRADRDRVAQADRPLGGRDADAVLALAAEELGALVGVVAQRAEHRPGGGEQAVLTGGGGELAQARPEDEPALEVAGHEAVVLQRDRQPVRRRSGQSGGRDELREGRRAGLEGAEDDGRLVEDADP